MAVAIAQAKLEQERKAAKIKELAESLQKWRDGELLHSGSLRNIPVALRLNSEKGVIQTNYSAEIPITDAFKLWPIILRVMKGEKDYTPGEPVGVYRLTKILKTGDIVVGCHNIAFSEIKIMADKLGLTQEVTL